VIDLLEYEDSESSDASLGAVEAEDLGLEMQDGVVSGNKPNPRVRRRPLETGAGQAHGPSPSPGPISIELGKHRRVGEPGVDLNPVKESVDCGLQLIKSGKKRRVMKGSASRPGS